MALAAVLAITLISATVGARINRDEKDYVLDHRRIRDGGVIAQLSRSGSWNSFTPKVGYPDTWRDYSALVIERGDLAAVTGGRYRRVRVDDARISQPVRRCPRPGPRRSSRRWSGS